MVDSSASMLDPGATVGNFEFAFNDTDLSDRILHVEIMEDSLGSRSDNQGGDCLPNRRKNLEEEKEGDVTHCQDLDRSTIVEVKTFHISSVIVAAKSAFFYKLFKNGMRESQQRDVTLRIYVSEEAALMELLKFMYSNTLSATTIQVSDLLGVLIVADKFQVTSCMRYCIELLQKMPMSLESALLYLALPSSILVGELVQPLIDATKLYLVAHFRDFSKSQEELMALPLSALEVVLGSDGMRVMSENDIFDFILKWVRLHYPKLEERRDILTKRLSQMICFPNITSWKLKEVLVCPEFDHEQVCKLVFNAFFFKVEGQITGASRDLSVPKFGYGERFYNSHPIKVVRFGLSRPRSVVYFELKKEECMDLCQSRNIFSERFHLGGQSFSLWPQYLQDQRSLLYHFGLSVISLKGSGSFTLDYEFEVMKKPLEVFESKYKGKVCNSTPNKSKCFRRENLFGVSWAEFMADESEYFIDGILHLRANLAITSPKHDW